uniref:Uncharacterized protein n=1 Tax=Fagus sylvatica TaxID=28930 RepID=A0A2N9GX85_FAGSY
MDDFTVEVHHGGSFAHDPLRLPTVSMEDGGLRVVSIDSDKDAMAMVDAVEGHNVIELFVEHCVDVPDVVEEHRTITAGFEIDEDVWFDNVFEECNEGNEVADTRLPDSSEEFSDSKESSDDDGHSNGANERCGGIEQERIKTSLSDNEEAYLSVELLSMDDDDVRPQYPVDKDNASASAAASKQLGSTAQTTASAHSGSNAHAQSTTSVHGHTTASTTATAGITSASSIARANVETSPSVPQEVKRSKNKSKSIVKS